MTACAPRRSSIMASASRQQQMHRHSGEQELCDVSRPDLAAPTSHSQCLSQQTCDGKVLEKRNSSHQSRNSIGGDVDQVQCRGVEENGLSLEGSSPPALLEDTMLGARLRPSRAPYSRGDDSSSATYIVGPVQQQRQQRIDEAVPAAISDVACEGKKVLRNAALTKELVGSDAVSETTEVFANGKWRKSSGQIPPRFRDNEEPINEEDPCSCESSHLKTITLEIDDPDQVAALVWHFGPEGGAWFKRMKEGVTMPNNHGLQIGDELVSINGNFVRGLPKDEIERVWVEIQDDESNDFLHLVLCGAPENYTARED